MAPLGDAWDSLPLQADGNVVFASFITLLSPNGDGVKRTGPPTSVVSGERDDAIVCVLASRDVVFFDFMGEGGIPREVQRFCGPPPLCVSRFMRTPVSSSAFCASLLPLDVSYMCRVQVASGGVPSSGAGAGSAGPVYLRGVVGTSDGRVDVFSEHGYVFGFVACDGPVVAVRPIYNVSVHCGENPAPPDEGGDQGRPLELATANLGFVTASADGVVYVWQRDSTMLKPTVLDRSAFLSRTVCWQAVQPSSRDWLLNGAATPRTPFVLYTTPGLASELRVRSAVTFDDVESRVQLPGGFATRTTAIASDEKAALVARGRNVYQVTFADASCVDVFEADSNVVGLHMSCGGGDILAAACDVRGTVYLLSKTPVCVCGRYRAGGGGPVQSVSLHAASRLLTIVGGDGKAEVVMAPESPDNAGAAPATTVLQCLVSLRRRDGDGAAAPGASE
ncbi:unnamed protein product [Trypanosoma congolense IL3000]|uniref:WGS project CAEQ00000000 data, annotated contig 1450 n=1 Tax=Trypanosoma congolense (strain IL3000) TaxID=1068625 RepID=F9W6E0_TRYCI|nr:unnamed protein product [Trypanosoma congolense IL3000]